MTEAGNIHFYEPKDGHRLAHDPFNAIIGPRPIGWVSTKGRDGSVNLAPYSFFNAFNYTPLILASAAPVPKTAFATFRRPVNSSGISPQGRLPNR